MRYVTIFSITMTNKTRLQLAYKIKDVRHQKSLFQSDDAGKDGINYGEGARMSLKIR